MCCTHLVWKQKHKFQHSNHTNHYYKMQLQLNMSSVVAGNPYCLNPNSTNSSVQQNLRLDYILTHDPPHPCCNRVRCISRLELKSHSRHETGGNSGPKTVQFVVYRGGGGGVDHCQVNLTLKHSVGIIPVYIYYLTHATAGSTTHITK